MSNSGEFEYINCVPSNLPADGTIKFNSMPIINFNIGAQERLLLGDSIKLTGDFIVKKADGTSVDNTDEVCIDPVVGVLSCFQQLNISSKRSNQTIEEIRDYNRFLASYFKAFQDKDELVTCDSLTGLKSQTLNQSNRMICDKPTLYKPFSVSLPSGFLMSNNGINLSSQFGIGGFFLQLLLAPSSNVLFSYKGGAMPVGEVGYYYELRNVRLKATVQRPTPEHQAFLQRNNRLVYNSISAHNTTISASYGTVNFNLGLQNVLSAFVSFVKGSNINSYRHGLATNGIQDENGVNQNITNVQWLKNNMIYPNQFEITDNNNFDYYNPILIRQYLNSIGSIHRVERDNVYDSINLKKNYANSAYGDWTGNALNVGIVYDGYSGNGVNFSQEQIGLIIESGLTDATSQQVFLFVCSRQELVLSPQGVTLIK